MTSSLYSIINGPFGLAHQQLQSWRDSSHIAKYLVNPSCVKQPSRCLFEAMLDNLLVDQHVSYFLPPMIQEYRHAENNIPIE